MRSDRELLELAAKAAGMAAGEYCEPNHEPALWHADYGFWQPLTDDGDALRLAVKLALTIEVQHHETEVFTWEGECLSSEHIFVHPKESYAATRRAIVCAAAEIGANMQEA